MLAITNGKVLTITNGVLESGTVLMDSGKITAVGENLVIPESADIIDAKGGYITPGLIDCHTHICNFCEPRMNPGPRMDGNEGWRIFLKSFGIKILSFELLNNKFTQQFCISV